MTLDYPTWVPASARASPASAPCSRPGSRAKARASVCSARSRSVDAGLTPATGSRPAKKADPDLERLGEPAEAR